MSIKTEVNKIANYATKLGFNVEIEEAATGSTYLEIFVENFTTKIRVSDHDPRLACDADYFVDPTANSVKGALTHIDNIHVEALEDEAAAEELALNVAEIKLIAALKRDIRKLEKKLATERASWFLTTDRKLHRTYTFNKDMFFGVTGEKLVAQLKYEREMLEKQFAIPALTSEEFESQLAEMRAR